MKESRPREEAESIGEDERSYARSSDHTTLKRRRDGPRNQRGHPIDPLTSQDEGNHSQLHPKPAQGPKKPSLRLRLVDAAAIAFDVVTAVLSVVDVVSDVFVAHQFYTTPGQMTWFWMVVASIFVSNCIYAGMMVVYLYDGRCGVPMSDYDRNRYGFTPEPRSKRRAVGLFLLYFPIAQAFPLLQWLSEMYPSKHMVESRERKKSRDANLSREDSWSAEKQGDQTDVGSAVREELGAGDGNNDDDSRQLLRMLHKGFKKHLQSHVGFYVETVVEAVPQSVIQLLAVTALGEATSVQLVSMCLSLFTIVSKAYVVSVALDLRAMVWKASLVAYDVFSAFFVFSTLVASNHAGDTQEYEYGVGPWWTVATVRTTWLSAQWIRLFVFCLHLAVVTGVGLGGYLTIDVWIVNGQRPWSESWVGFFIAGIFSLMLIPVGIVFEGMKLSWLLLGLHPMQPTTDVPFFALGWHFVSRGFAESDAEGTRRLKHFLSECVRLITPNFAKLASWSVSYNTYYIAAAKDHLELNRLTIWNCRMPSYHDFSSNLSPARLRERPMWRFGLIEEFAQMLDVAKTSERLRNTIVVAWCAFLFAVTVASVLFNLAFPFLHTWLYGWSSLNVLQAACLVSSVVALCVCVSGLRHGYHYANYVVTVRQLLLWQWDMPSLSPGMLSRLVAAYCRPPYCTALQRYVSTTVLPHEVVVECVGAYLAPSDVDLSGLSAAECAQLRELAPTSAS